MGTARSPTFSLTPIAEYINYFTVSLRHVLCVITLHFHTHIVYKLLSRASAVQICVLRRPVNKGEVVSINGGSGSSSSSSTRFGVKYRRPFNLILYGPFIILQYICNPTRYAIFDD